MTAEGQILAAVEAKPKEVTPLQEKLDVIAIDIGRLGMYAAIVIFHLLVARNMIESTVFRKFSALEKPQLCSEMQAKSEIKYYCDA